MKLHWAFTIVAAPLVLAGAAGCEQTAPETAALTASTVRAQRRLYDGAPPVIPHPPLNIACTQCHTDVGKEAPPLGFAPANPHAGTAGLSGLSNCQQCHVFRRGEEVFVDSDFAGLAQAFARADRLYPGAPPVIPHPVFMRENCNSCHSGPTARPEIRCAHAQRTNCRQCHVPVRETHSLPTLAQSPSGESPQP